jgi:hypothetical protein
MIHLRKLLNPAALVIGFSFLSSVSAEAGTLYATSAAGGPGELYILDPTTGAMVTHIGSLNDALNVNYPITGLAVNPITGVMYGSTGNAGSVDAMLVTVNLGTALVTPIGFFNAGPTNSSGTPTTMADLAFDSAGNLYGIGSIGGPQLYSINPATGKATVIGSTGLTSTTGGGLAISPGGVFYGTPTASRFGTYDPLTGAYSNITNPTKPTGGGAYGALEFDGNILYGLNVGSGSPPPTALVTISPLGVVTSIGTSLNSLDAIAFVPEPGTAALLVVAGAVVLLRSRKH